MPELSGPAWVPRFPESASTSTLTANFKAAVDRFLAALSAAGASVNIACTLRPLQRAYLMHFCFRIANESLDPTTVPPQAGVDIDWVHRNGDGSVDLSASRNAAAQMVAGYHIVSAPAFPSRHTQARAIDMNISWAGNLTIAKADGSNTTITTDPKSGLNPELHTVGATYGVHKLLGDPPHWSDDGH